VCCGGLWAAEARGGLAFGRRPIHEPLHQPDLQSFESDASLQAIELRALGAKVGATNLTPENVALQGLRFTVAFMLSFRGSPLGVISYVDPSGAPVLLCIIANHAPNAPTFAGSARRSRRTLEQAGPPRTRENDPSGVQKAALAQLCLSAYETRGKAWTTRVVFDSLARTLESGRAWRGVGSVKKLLHL
jgi:hypothetical protein